MTENYTFLVRDDLKHEYQEGRADEVKINCANGKIIMVHDCVLSFASKYLRTIIRKAKIQQRFDGPVELDFTVYPEESVKVTQKLDLRFPKKIFSRLLSTFCTKSWPSHWG